VYDRIAKTLADRVNAAFESEATLEAEFKRNYANLPFDRTNFWQGIIYNMLREAWYESGPGVKTEPTGYDRLATLRELRGLLDYNLFSQVLLNLQTYNGMGYQSLKADKEIERLKEEWKAAGFKLDPFAEKAKMVKQAEAVSEEQKRYNTVVSSLKALRIISQFNPQVSFRVSPKGSTPAFADSQNLSLIGEGGDRYLRTLPTLAVWYVTWTVRPALAYFVPPATAPSVPAKPDPRGMEFRAEGVPYPFFSKSGGDILQDVLFVRRLVWEIAGDVDPTQENCTLLPRMNSILAVADKYGISLKKSVERLQKQFPTLSLVEGPRA
jgi:hypothetical protein